MDMDDQIAEQVAAYDTETAESESLQGEPETTPRRVIGRPWLPGQTGNPNGRPLKGMTLAERVAAADAKVARKALRARDQRLVREDMVGEKAWTTYLAYNLGLPKQPFVHTFEVDPLMGLLPRLLDPDDVIEGEHKLLDEGD